MDKNLSKLLETQKIPHALLFINGESEALGFAQALLKTSRTHHPDLHHYYPEGKTGMHPLTNIHQVAAEVALAPFEAPYKVFVIHAAERMLPPSSNALLKTLEEPTARTVILLLTEHREAILPTVLSRCHIYTFAKQQQEPPFLPHLLALLAGDESQRGPLEKLFESEEKGAAYFEQVDQLCEALMKWHRDCVALYHGAPHHLLFYPNKCDSLVKQPPHTLEEVERRVKEGRLALERAMPFPLCLQHMLFACNASF